MKKMKKMKKLLLVLWMMIGLVQGKTVFAANGDFTKATDIQVNKAVTDKMEKSADYNYYKFTLPAAGYINMSFSHAELESISRMWKTLKGVSGYQIVTATDKNFKKNKKITQINSKKKSKTIIEKLKSKKKHYVKMRGYITVGGVTYYGPWSKVKTVTIK